MDRNKGILIVIAVLTLGLLVGCASRSTVHRMETQLDALQAQNEILQEKLVNTKTEGSKKTGSVHAVGMAPMMPMARDAHRMSNPPKTWASLNREPLACKETPLHYKIRNYTNLHIQLQIDGEPVKVFGGQGTLPFLPPKETVHLCLDAPGRHRVSGIAYTGRHPHLVEVKRFSAEVYTDSANLGYTLYIDTKMIDRNSR